MRIELKILNQKEIYKLKLCKIHYKAKTRDQNLKTHKNMIFVLLL